MFFQKGGWLDSGHLHYARGHLGKSMCPWGISTQQSPSLCLNLTSGLLGLPSAFSASGRWQVMSRLWPEGPDSHDDKEWMVDGYPPRQLVKRGKDQLLRQETVSSPLCPHPATARHSNYPVSLGPQYLYLKCPGSSRKIVWVTVLPAGSDL